VRSIIRVVNTAPLPSAHTDTPFTARDTAELRLTPGAGLKMEKKPDKPPEECPLQSTAQKQLPKRSSPRLKQGKKHYNRQRTTNTRQEFDRTVPVSSWGYVPIATAPLQPRVKAASRKPSGSGASGRLGHLHQQRPPSWCYSVPSVKTHHCQGLTLAALYR